jgi:asparagine synthase (glutamine-hydrolysing)
MSRITGSHSTHLRDATAAVERTLAAIGGGYPVQRTILESGRCALGLMGRHELCVAEVHSTISVVDGLFYNRDELDRTAGLNGATANDAMRLAMLFRLRGVEAALSLINGDFAAAIYDGDADTLWLARDRFGVKPLYFVHRREQLTFASRPGALLSLPDVSSDVNRRFVAMFAGGHYRHIDNNPSDSPFKDVRQLPAASLLKSCKGMITVSRYWDLTEQPEYSADEAELAARYRDLLLDAVGRRVAVANAPAFTLSGGLDSSSVLSCAVARTGERQHAFSSVYVDPTFDETAEIRSMLDTKVLQWHPVSIGTPDVMGIVRKMVAAHDEPIATATWLSHFILCEEAARAGFGTIFGGLGGDELNAGEYEYFFFLFADLRRAGLKRQLDQEIAEWARHHDHPIYRKNAAIVEQNLAQIVDLAQAGICRPDDRRMTRYFGAVEPDFFELSHDRHVMDHPFTSYLKNRTYQDLFRETAPCCLRAEDRQCEYYGLQHIEPFFDHRLAEFMFRVPGNMKIRDGITKRLLREAMAGILPEETRTRIKKTGWNAPAHDWFGKGRVADAVRDLIGSRAFRERGIYNMKYVERMLDEHRKIVNDALPVENHMMFLWQLVNLELWFETVVDRQPAFAT